MNDLAQLKCCKLGCMFLTSLDIIVAIRQLLRASEIVIRLQEQLNIDPDLVNQNDDPTLRWQLTSRVSTLFASTIFVIGGYHQCQTNSRAQKVTCI